MILLFSFLLLLLPQVHALGVSPGRLSFSNVLPGGYAAADLLVSNPKPIPILLNVSARGDGADWLSLSLENQTLPPGGTTTLRVAINPPEDAEPRTYALQLQFNSRPLEVQSKKGVASRIALSLTLPLSFSITSTRRPSCILGGFTLPDVEAGRPLRGAYMVKNDGNVRVTPRGTLTVTDATGATVYTLPVAGNELLPTTTKRFSFHGASLPEGSYDASLTLQCGTATATFTVHPPGTLATRGSFTLLSPVKDGVVARFANTGESAVEARFQGVVLHDGKVVRVVESDPLLVTPGESNTFKEFLSLPPGAYELRGAITYEGRKTPERSVTIVIPGKKIPREHGFSLWNATLALLFSILLLLIIRKKRRTL